MRDYTLIDGDLLDADAEFICHQVNCQGKMLIFYQEVL